MNLAVKVSLALGGSLMLAGVHAHSKAQDAQHMEEFRRCRRRLGQDVKSCTLNENGVTWTFHVPVPHYV
jgi:hypothetical protein